MNAPRGRRDGANAKPRNAIVLIRKSEIKLRYDDGAGKGVVYDEHAIRRHARSIGWTIGRVIIENDLTPDGKASAFKRKMITLPDGSKGLRTVRPGFRLALDLLMQGVHDGLIVVDLDRLARQPRDLEDLIDVVEWRYLPVTSVTGSLRLDDDAAITQARIMCAIANKSSRDTARRVAGARERAAMDGDPATGGNRPFGFEANRITVRESEAEVVRWATEAVLQGDQADSLRSLAADLRKRGVPTVTGAKWSPETLRDILIRPRNIGRTVYRGEEIADARWPAIVDVDQYRAVVALLTDPARNAAPGPTRTYLGSGVYLCGVCGHVCEGNGGGKGRASYYRCKSEAGAHFRANADGTDECVVETVLAFLAQPGVVEAFLPVAPAIDAAALRAERTALRGRLDEAALAFAAQEIDRAQLRTTTASLRARLDAIDAKLTASVATSPLAPFAGSTAPAEVWQRASTLQRREILNLLVVVTFMPTARRGAGFDTSRVRITWKLTPTKRRSARAVKGS